MRTEDGSIIHRCFNGEPEAFGILVDKYKEGIYAFVHTKLRDFRDAQDVTQEVFVRAYRDLHSLRRWESFAFWLYRIASARCKLWVRTQSRRVDQDLIEDQDPKALEVNSMSAYRDNQVSKSLQESMDSLPEIYREVLMLHYFGGMTIKDIARAIGVSPGAIGMRLSRARAQLKEEMIAMMDTAFEGQRLQAGFTFRIVEAVKRIKIRPMPRVTGLPWGLSLAAGIIITVLSLNPYMNLLNPMETFGGSPRTSEMRVIRDGEIPVDILEISQMPALAAMQGDGNDGKPDPVMPALMAAQGEGDTWTKKTDMPTPRFGHGAAVIDGKIYVIGGSHANVTGLPTMQVYDPVADAWDEKADMPTKRYFHSTSVVNGKIYVIGGCLAPWTARPVVEVYDPDNDTWVKKADMPTSRAAHATSVVDGLIYAIGGVDNNKNPLSTVEAYDPATDTWTKKTNMPTRRSWLSTCVVDGIIYAIGGSAGLGNFGIRVVEAYDPVADNWVRVANMPTARGWLATSVVDGKIYALGGTNAAGAGSSTVEVYDPLTDTWTKKADMPTKRHSLSTSAASGRIYAIGGSLVMGGGNLSTVEEYIPGELQPEEQPGFSVSPQGNLPTKWGEVKSD